MHFYQENREKKSFETQNYQSKGCTAESFNSLIPCFTILKLRTKLDLVHLKSHVKYKSDIKQPKCGYIKESGGGGGGGICVK